MHFSLHIELKKDKAVRSTVTGTFLYSSNNSCSVKDNTAIVKSETGRLVSVGRCAIVTLLSQSELKV